MVVKVDFYTLLSTCNEVGFFLQISTFYFTKVAMFADLCRRGRIADHKHFEQQLLAYVNKHLL